MSRPVPEVDWFVRICVLLTIFVGTIALIGLAFLIEDVPLRGYSPDGRLIVEEVTPGAPTCSTP